MKIRTWEFWVSVAGAGIMCYVLTPAWLEAIFKTAMIGGAQ